MTHHLGSTISALLDGRLAPAAARRAWEHLDVCPRCAAELADAREARRLLNQTAALPPPSPTEELTARLLALQSGAPVGPRPDDPFAEPSPHDRLARDYAGSRGLRGEVHPRRPVLRLVAAPALGLAAVAVVLVVLGSRPVVEPTTHPAVVLDMLGEAAAANVVVDRRTGAAPDLAALRAAGWAIPDSLPGGWHVTATSWVSGTQILQVDLSGPDGTAVVTEQQGRLAGDALASVATLSVGDRQVLALSDSPWTVAWQARSTVVQVVAAREDVEVDDLVGAFPAGPYDDGVPARIGRGWSTLTAVFAGG
jgi:hypothetical protein